MKTKLVCLFLFASMLTFAHEGHTLRIKANVVTGVNALMGEPLWDLGPGFGTLFFETVGAYQPEGDQASRLNRETLGNTLLATYVDPVFLSLFGLTPEAVPAEYLNLPLRDVPVIVDPSGTALSSLPDIHDAGMLDYSRAASNDQVTLRKWLRASGKAVLRCNRNGGSVSLTLKDMIPNGLYSVSAVFMSDEGPVAIPLGGVPNVFTSDAAGNATFKRELNFCWDNTANLGELLIIDVTWHSNHSLYGTQTNLPFADSFAGTVNHIHLSFLVNGEAL